MYSISKLASDTFDIPQLARFDRLERTRRLDEVLGLASTSRGRLRDDLRLAPDCRTLSMFDFVSLVSLIVRTLPGKWFPNPPFVSAVCSSKFTSSCIRRNVCSSTSVSVSPSKSLRSRSIVCSDSWSVSFEGSSTAWSNSSSGPSSGLSSKPGPFNRKISPGCTIGAMCGCELIITGEYFVCNTIVINFRYIYLCNFVLSYFFAGFLFIMTSQIPDSIVHLLKSANFIHLGTCSNNVPHVSLMNFTLITPEDKYNGQPGDDYYLLISTPKDTQKYKNLSVNPQCSILVHDWTTSKASGSAGDGQLLNFLKELNQSQLCDLSCNLNGYVEKTLDQATSSPEADYYKDLHLKSNPDAKPFIEKPGNVLLLLRIELSKVVDSNFNISNYS
ncbi:hypothetical protein OGAPHI_004808 [Ogataea philodendri]|uniref:Pyridoxamine 5'-phosphate oxidase N-terminal domain-containing protein n=1 Tax=Ogataea philodendri TaxID=1378263 RepID=A0A9P8P3P1_9ASCO|nr:uncharacterized protein OGAPHI_004808 [Ogataea philodendri]KAH3664094.1 hypothetical protein OGAPHI_004808 [Ogataea philodendri]